MNSIPLIFNEHQIQRVIIGGKTGENACDICFPCGMCRQFLSEFAADDMQVILPFENNVQIYDFKSLFPHGFKL